MNVKWILKLDYDAHCQKEELHIFNYDYIQTTKQCGGRVEDINYANRQTLPIQIEINEDFTKIEFIMNNNGLNQIMKDFTGQ